MTTQIDHRTPYEAAADEWVCRECGRALPESDAPHEDWGEPGFCNAWCKFAYGLEGEQHVQAMVHQTLQMFMDTQDRGSRFWCVANRQCEVIDNWFAAKGVETPEW